VEIHAKYGAVVVSALLMFRRVARAVRYAIREEEFIPVVTAGSALVLIGTVTYALGEGWNIVDALYFAVATLTTTSVADPELVLDSRWMKVFTVLYLLIGIGILVEVLRRLGFAFVTVRAQERKAHAARLRGEKQESPPGERAPE
jgi:Ion channel